MNSFRIRKNVFYRITAVFMAAVICFTFSGCNATSGGGTSSAPSNMNNTETSPDDTGIISENDSNDNDLIFEDTSDSELTDSSKNPSNSSAKPTNLTVETIPTAYNEAMRKYLEQFNSVLPIIYIDTNDSSIGAVYRDASIAIYASSDYDSTIEYAGNTQIKLRGNSTQNRDKHPYKLKLETKADLFDLGKSKHWVLLANDIDHTQIRNKITMDFAISIGMETTSSSILVSLVLNGKYEGIYQLAEHVRVGKDQVNIYDWEDTFGKNYALAAKDIETTTPQTGGFLLEADFYAYGNNTISKIITNFMQPFYFNTPEYVAKDTELYSYTKNYIQSFEYALHSPDFTYHAEADHYAGRGNYFDWSKQKWIGNLTKVEYTDTTFDNFHYSELFDIDSLVNNMLVCEISRNWDSMKNSVFLYKDINGLAYMGPEWDFDWAYGNVNMYNIDTNYPTGWQTTDGYFTNEQYYQSVQWNTYLIKDPYFVYCLYVKYHEIRNTAIKDLMNSCDYYLDYLLNDATLNDSRWNYTYNGYYYSGGKTQRFKPAMNSLKSFITQRIDWLDEQFADFDTLLDSLGGYKDSRDLMASIKSDGQIKISYNNKNAAKIRVFINGNKIEDIELTDCYFIPEEYQTSGIAVFYLLDAEGNYLLQSSTPEAQAITAYAVW